jgi:hypothetical protein
VATALEAVEAGTTVASGESVASFGLSRSGDLTLEVLMRQALEVPGAASALLEAFAAQASALRLVQEADARGAATLPAEIRNRLASVAKRTPVWLAATSAL